jgi:hypothetical protein
MPPEIEHGGRQSTMARELIGGDVFECLKRELEKTEERALRLRAAIAGYESAIESPPPQQPGGLPESQRWLSSNGKPMRPIEAMETLLQEHQGEMPTKELFDLLVSGGAFNGKKRSSASYFKSSIGRNVGLGKITQVDASGYLTGERYYASASQCWPSYGCLSSTTVRSVLVNLPTTSL